MSQKKDTKRKAYERGIFSEKLAALFLRAKGYKILNERYRTPLGEIDLVARKRNRIIFVEVKSRKTIDEALHSVSPRQRERIVSAAEMWLAEMGVKADEYRFDVILLTPGALPTHIKNAFLQE